jgi:hypothetical protein
MSEKEWYVGGVVIARGNSLQQSQSLRQRRATARNHRISHRVGGQPADHHVASSDGV